MMSPLCLAFNMADMHWIKIRGTYTVITEAPLVLRE